MLVDICNLSFQEAETGGSPKLHGQLVLLVRKLQVQ